MSDVSNVSPGAANVNGLENGVDDPQASRALTFVRTLMEKMLMNAEVNLAPDDGEGSADEIRLEIEGPDAGRVIGKRGAVLEAIQYLTTRVVHRPGEPRKHVAVDAEGYRARHEDQLAQMARRLGERVAAEGKIITFDPMSARDRRIVHMALKDVGGVRTESNGEGPDRRVQIIPASLPSTNIAAAVPRARPSRPRSGS
ncbi:KH domain-containing protein [Pendulispora rubella]|uniref:KH domain-containing protein n=1 Tax=Pendulispora rubella TaxID=2741070 RepID=A0ABZ2L3I7_9BACT